MKNRSIEQFGLEHLKLLESQRFVEKDLDYSVLERHIPYLENISELSNSVISIFDMYKKEHAFVSKNIEKVLNVNREKAMLNHNEIDRLIHPDDLMDLFEAGLYFLKYGFTAPPEIRRDYKLVNEYRMLNEKNKYIRVIEQQMCLENDCHGNVWLALGILDISPDQTENSPFRSRLVNILTGDVYLFPPVDKKAMLTAREKEILQLISKGLLSKEIADKLYISVNTVNTHRQRILEKLDAENAIEAIKYASKLGLI